jgi:hypothetical protein
MIAGQAMTARQSGKLKARQGRELISQTSKESLF